MKCMPSDTPKPEEIDISAMRERYRHERDKRLRTEGQNQYFRPTGEVAANFSADPHTEVKARDPINEDIECVVVGAGWGGILAGYYLTKAGVTNFRNIDTAGDFGGVWYWNRYPGIQCDNESYCYLPLLEEMGFMPSKRFADGAEIYEYAKSIPQKFGFADNALFHTHVKGLRWDESIKRWRVTTNRGDEIRARFVIVAPGVLNMPKLPGIEGIDTFKGKIFHTARWDYDYTGGSYRNPTLDKLKDKRVAIVGTGATAIQAVPNLAKYAKHLFVVQRTPSCVDARPNPPTDPNWASSLEPGWQEKRKINFHHGAMEGFQPDEPDLVCDFWTEINRNISAKMSAAGWPQMPMEQFMAMRETEDHLVMERMRRRVDAIVKDPATAEALKPYYNFLCKRPLSSEEFYQAFNKPNVDLLDVSDTKGVERITEKGFIANGKEHEVDCIIFASGFEVTSDLQRRWGMDVIEGRGGVSLYDHWRKGPLTLHGAMTHGFPNQFYIGYIQGGLNASVTEQFGRQGEHAALIIGEALKKGITSIEPTQEAQDEYVRLFESLEFPYEAVQSACPPSYFNNEGEAATKWFLFRAWGRGWDDFLKMLKDWRDKGDMEGMVLTK